MRPPEKDWPPPDTFACQLRLGSLPLPFDWNGPFSFSWIGCWSWATPSTFAVNCRLTFALWIEVLNALLIVSLASWLLPPPPPPHPASRATSAATERISAARSGVKTGDFKRSTPNRGFSSAPRVHRSGGAATSTCHGGL